MTKLCDTFQQSSNDQIYTFKQQGSSSAFQQTTNINFPLPRKANYLSLLGLSSL